MAAPVTATRRATSRFRADKPLTFLLCTLPLAWLTARAFAVAGLSLGPNPVEALIHGLGSWGLRLLLITLCVRPLAVLLRQPRLMRLRRMLGLFAFTYLVLHFLSWFVIDRALDLAGILPDIAKRPYITVGFTALLLLVPLAVTSTDRWMRRLGRRWHTLHRLVYPAALLGCLHFLWLVKADWREPALYLVLFTVLMGWRWRQRPRRRAGIAPALSPRGA
ncbi:MAG: sulfoxide reductase heme-binding subunit YedZ [Steroidobacteraceae bacterium]|jgi:sulfoxide reductase heme-binding subunit YedZ|nr:sulfoxide reductase heme-binding subunit YedZ [Steroidobacteraceae bacterium]